MPDLVPYNNETDNRQLLTWFCGINYVGKFGYELGGCVNDATNLYSMVHGIYGTCGASTVLVDESNHFQTSNRIPTRENIVRTLEETVNKIPTTPCTMVVTYAGHGIPLQDYSNDELDGEDECLVPLDCMDSGYIKDDQLNTILVQSVAAFNQLRMIVIMDCCHSGSILDLPYMYINGKWTVASINEDRHIKATIIMLSGCKDNQTSADAYIDGQQQGAMSRSFRYAMDRLGHYASIADILVQMRSYLRVNEYNQIPQLSCSQMIDVNKPLFLEIEKN
jgi:hypothetical protein